MRCLEQKYPAISDLRMRARRRLPHIAWEYLKEVCDQWEGPLIVKGLLHTADTEQANPKVLLVWFQTLTTLFQRSSRLSGGVSRRCLFYCFAGKFVLPVFCSVQIEIRRYNASKAGVLGLTAAFAEQVTELGIRVNAILPSLVESRDFGWNTSG